jgi:hypothetical protein
MIAALRHAAIVLLLTLGAVECTLQGASVVGRSLLAKEASPAGATTRILCVGDSHTFGAPLPRHESYPAQLQQALDERSAGPRFDVVNLGIPGANSAFVARRLGDQLLQYDPQLVIVWVGANNFWNATGTQDWGTTDTWGKVRRQLLRIKLFRFGVAEWARRNSPSYEPVQDIWLGNETVTFDRRKEHLSWEAAGRGMVHDMERMVATTRAYDIPILFISYPVPFGVNPYIADTAERLGVPRVDSMLDLDRAIADGYEMDDLIVDSMGPHPRRPLYRYVVDTLIPRIDDILEVSSAPFTDRSTRRSPD